MKLSRNTKRRLVFYGGLLAVFTASALFCSSMPGRSFRGAPPPLDAREGRYEAELRQSVDALSITIGPRNVNRAHSLRDAAAYLDSALRDAGYAPTHHPYTVDGVVCDNVDVEVPGTSRAREVVLVGAHYDSVDGVPGADDNATGTAATLALARALRGHPLARTLRFAFFANEEPPHFWSDQMGSLVYARELRARGDDVVAMLSLESIGYFRDDAGSQRYLPPMSLLYPSRGDFIAFVGNLGSRALTRHAVDLFRRSARVPSEGAALPAKLPGVGWSDQWSFWQVAYPGVMVTDTAPFRNPNYHTSHDVSSTLDYARMARVVAGVEDVLRALAAE